MKHLMLKPKGKYDGKNRNGMGNIRFIKVFGLGENEKATLSSNMVVYPELFILISTESLHFEMSFLMINGKGIVSQ